MFYGLGAFSLILYFRVKTGTRTTLFNGGLVVYAFGFGAFSHFLYFRIQIGTKTNLLNGGLVAYTHGLVFKSHRVLPCTNRHQNQAYLTGV